MNSSPSFDPNLFLYGIDQNLWNKIKNDPLKPLINKTVSGLYSPGSTIKPLVALSALENDVITPNMRLNAKVKLRCTIKNIIAGRKRSRYHGFKKLN